MRAHLSAKNQIQRYKITKCLFLDTVQRLGEEHAILCRMTILDLTVRITLSFFRVKHELCQLTIT